MDGWCGKGAGNYVGDKERHQEIDVFHSMVILMVKVAIRSVMLYSRTLKGMINICHQY